MSMHNACGSRTQSSASCGTGREEIGQPFPISGHLANNSNLSLEELKRSLRGDGNVYAYVLSSLSIQGKKGSGQCQLIQTGCAPNFQGGYITLCTCKHQMRSRLSKDCWSEAWIAGFTSRHWRGKHYLFYLMRVAEAFDSYPELWSESEMADRTKQAKCASKNIFGDLYLPLKRARTAFRPESYRRPVSGHRHHQWVSDRTWNKDIRYVGRSQRHPALLVGQREASFLWNTALISSRKPLPRDYRRYESLKAFVRSLE